MMDFESECSSIDTCEFTQRIIDVLKQYQSLNVSNDKQNTEILYQFCNEKYHSMIDDYIHIIIYHNNQQDLSHIINIINQTEGNHFAPCNISKCIITKRHYRNRHKDPTSIQSNIHESEYLVFWRDTIDSMHFYLNHLFDTALRVKSVEIKQDDTNDTDVHYQSDNPKTAETVNQRIKKIQQIIKQKQAKLNLNTQEFDKDKYNMNKYKETLMDAVLNLFNLNNPHQSQLNIDHISHWLMVQHEYDTDALKDDIGHVCDDSNHGQQSNIALALGTDNFDLVKDFVKSAKCM